MNKVSIVEWLLLLGGTLAVSARITLLLFLGFRPGASINWLNSFTLVLGFLAGTITLVYPGSLRVLVAATLILLLAAVPAVFGMAWVLYVPSILLISIGTTAKFSQRYFLHRRSDG